MNRIESHHCDECPLCGYLIHLARDSQPAIQRNDTQKPNEKDRTAEEEVFTIGFCDRGRRTRPRQRMTIRQVINIDSIVCDFNSGGDLINGSGGGEEKSLWTSNQVTDWMAG